MKFDTKKMKKHLLQRFPTTKYKLVYNGNLSLESADGRTGGFDFKTTKRLSENNKRIVYYRKMQ